jgi:hypothetical protein
VHNQQVDDTSGAHSISLVFLESHLCVRWLTSMSNESEAATSGTLCAACIFIEGPAEKGLYRHSTPLQKI